jgi:mitosis inhibitor protein kinase SWE1
MRAFDFRGPPWHKLRQENFDAYFDGLSGALAQLIRDLMRTDPTKRLTIDQVCSNAIVGRARGWMNAKRAKAGKEGRTAILGSALAQEKEGFLKDVLGVDDEMDLSD